MTPGEKIAGPCDCERFRWDGMDECLPCNCCQINAAISAAVEAERLRCKWVAIQSCLPIGCTAVEADGVVRRTRECIADEIMKGA
jgi:hypothetical protein